MKTKNESQKTKTTAPYIIQLTNLKQEEQLNVPLFQYDQSYDIEYKSPFGNDLYDLLLREKIHRNVKISKIRVQGKNLQQGRWALSYTEPTGKTLVTPIPVMYDPYQQQVDIIETEFVFRFNNEMQLCIEKLLPRQTLVVMLFPIYETEDQE